MAVIRKWDVFFNRTDLTTNDNFQIVGLDLSNPTVDNQDQRSPITQILRSGKNLSDLLDVPTAVTNLGATSASTVNALVRRSASGTFNASSATLDGATTPSLTISGPTATIFMASATGGNQIFTGTVSGDVGIRQSNTARQLLLGVGSGAAQFAVLNTVIQSNITHRFAYAGTNRMPFLNGTSDLTASANYTVNGTGGLTITQGFTAATGTFSGLGGVVIGGTSPSANIGANTQYGAASAGNQFFNPSLTGDTCIRNTNTSNFVRIGVGAANAQCIIGNTYIELGVPLILGTSTPDASAIILANSTTRGLLPPRMTTIQKNAIASPTAGLIVYDTTLGKLCVHGAAAWETITSV